MQDLTFHCAATTSYGDGPVALHLASLRGVERLSGLFEFELVLEERGAEATVAYPELLGAPAHVALGGASGREVHGMLREVELLPVEDGRPLRYRAVLVPRLWRATQALRSRVFAEGHTVGDVVRRVLTETGLRELDPDTGLGDFTLRLAEAHPQRDYTVQYGETDFDFASRLMEAEGVFYYFVHGEGRELLVVTDTNAAFGDEALYPLRTLSYATRSAGSGVTEAAQSFTHRARVLPRRVVVRDYNERFPEQVLTNTVDRPVDERHWAGPRGGLQSHYGDALASQNEANRVALLRAQALLATQHVFAARTTARDLHPGRCFALAEHPVPSLDGDYVVVEARHRADQSQGANAWATEGAARAYENEVAAIPRAVAFRPPRRTPKPVIAGVVPAVIDGPPSAAVAAPVDASGSYRVVFPFDTVARPETLRSSCPVRLAQPYLGVSSGVHMPLRKGAAVLVAHVHGDPDRPVILGAVPTPYAGNIITSNNPDRNILQSRSGVQIELDDDARET